MLICNIYFHQLIHFLALINWLIHNSYISLQVAVNTALTVVMLGKTPLTYSTTFLCIFHVVVYNVITKSHLGVSICLRLVSKHFAKLGWKHVPRFTFSGVQFRSTSTFFATPREGISLYTTDWPLPRHKDTPSTSV